MSVLTLNQQIRNGLSNARNSSQYNNINGSVDNGAASLLSGGSSLGTDISTRIERANREVNIKEFQFPTDMPKYHFRLLENEWGITSSGLTIERIYTFPLPMQGMQDNSSVNYDTNYSPISEALSGAQNAFQGLNVVSAIGRQVGAVTGRALNTFKTITLAAPDFKEFSLSWKLSPKNFDEAQSIQKIYWSLRRGMSPRFDPILDRLLFVFPKIYTMYFVPNVRYLYKFKPCVLTNLSVNFTGGNPHPTFYKPQGADSESPPESVIMTMTFLELEYWVQSDIDADSGRNVGNTGEDDLPSNNPFDVWNWYTYARENPTTT